jgi:hypothetical protein
VLSTFAGTYSDSLQQMLYAIGTALVETVPSACEARLSLPNKHHYLVDLAPYGQDNDREVYLLLVNVARGPDLPAAARRPGPGRPARPVLDRLTCGRS